MFCMIHFRMKVSRVVHLNDWTNKMALEYMHLLCAACKEVKTMRARRGRPPKFCKECIENGNTFSYEQTRRELAKARAEARVDRLEMMLKSIGSHPSQQENHER